MQSSRQVLFTLASLTVVALAATITGASNADLIAAARKPDLKAAEAALAGGADVNAATPYGVTALMYAADRGDLGIVKLLISRGANVNAKDSFYNGTALGNAAEGKHAAIVQALLEAGAEGAGDVLAAAVREDSPDVVKAVLASKKADAATLGAALATAQAAGKADVAKLLAEAGAVVPEAQPGTAVSPETLSVYAGTYKNSELGMEITFTPAEGKLKGAVAGQPQVTYSPKSETAFESVEFPGITVTFLVAEGKATGLTVEQGGRSFNFARAAATPPASAAAPAPAPGAPAPATPAAPEPTGPIAVKNWPSFRGMGATGVADGQRPPAKWDAATGENLLWKAPIPGLGLSSPIVWGDRVFVTTAVSSAEETEFRAGLYGDVASVPTEPSHQWKLLALDAGTGRVLWERQAHEGVPKVKRHTKASHANSTPATDGRHVVAMFGGEGLYVYDVEGNLKWKKDLGTLDSGFFYDPDDQWGFGSSPILYEGMVIVQADVQEGSFVAAFAAADGKELWRTSRDEICSWGSPTVIEGPSRAELVTNGTKFVRGYDPMTGKELWRLGRNAEITVPTPFVAHDLIFVTSGYAPIQPIYAIKPGASGDITLEGEAETNASIAWSKKRGGPYMPTPIVYGDHLYTVGNNGVLTCYDAKTGAQVYKGRVSGTQSAAFTASPVAADGKLYFTSEEGDVYVVKAGPTYELLATNSVGEVCLATPAISGGRFFVRGQNTLFAAGRPVTTAAAAR